jgi:2-desacetyl-2-hydroxyethyl bacteriochlorophyllide A dehydrogenase
MPNRLIKQVIVQEKGRVGLESVEWDGTVRPDEFIVRTERTFISAGTELAIYTAKEPAVYRKGAWCAYPFRPGYANVGIVEELGAEVTEFTRGQRVFTLGAHASHVKFSRNDLAVAVPAGLDPDVAAASRMAGVATAAMVMADRALPQPTVLVFGLGMVGNLAAQSFRILGGKVVGVDPVAERRAMAERCGIVGTLPGGEPAQLKAGLKRLAGVEQADICIDATGRTPVVLQALALTADVGQLILLGTPRGPCEGDLTAAFNEIHLRNIAVRGALEWCLPTYPVKSIWGGRTPPLMSLWDKQRLIFDWILDRKLLLDPLISHRLPAASIRAAYEGLLNEPERFTGVVLEWS